MGKISGMGVELPDLANKNARHPVKIATGTGHPVFYLAILHESDTESPLGTERSMFWRGQNWEGTRRPFRILLLYFRQ